MLFTVAFLVNYFPDHLVRYNAHFWSLCVEMQFYLAIAAVVLMGGKKAIWIVWPACLAITAMRVHEGAYYHIQTHLRVDEILAGACVATVYRPCWQARLTLPIAPAALAAVLWMVCAAPSAGWCQYFRPYATALFLGACLCQGETHLAAFLTSRCMRYIATVSYALYIIHPATIQGWWNEGSVFDRYLLKRPISFAMTFGLAHISTFYWERLWSQAGRNWVLARRMRRTRSAE
jgi:peptidoglycan/LPS O-acetylase OafA/YrhL